jgi:hypothetical protein
LPRLSCGGAKGVEVIEPVIDPVTYEGNGPKVFKPKFLRTKGGDIGLCGVTSNADVGVKQGRLGLGCSDPPVPVSSKLGLLIGGNQPNTSRLNESDRGKGGRTKKAMKKSCPYPRGNKFTKFQELCKGGLKPRRKRILVDTHQELDDDSEDADTIDSCDGDDQVDDYQHVCDYDGIGLEVVLSRPIEEEEVPIGSIVPCSFDGGRVGRSSGLVDLLGDTMPNCSNIQAVGGMVDKDRGDAFHVVDIQKDIGMNFKGKGDEDVERSMKYEGRDREKKREWVQGSVNQ